jgi:hypothetical protein
MTGTKPRACAPLCDRSLEDLVPASSFYRHLKAGSIRVSSGTSSVRPLKERGRPSVDPRVFFKLQLVMFFEALRSERELIKVAADPLSVRWYLGYDLDEELPDRSSLTRVGKRYGLAVCRRFGYRDHYAVDGGKARIILTVLATPADVMENLPLDCPFGGPEGHRTPHRFHAKNAVRAGGFSAVSAAFVRDPLPWKPCRDSRLRKQCRSLIACQAIPRPSCGVRCQPYGCDR